MVNEPELLRLLEIAAQRVRHHHDALWEEEKHYSWWIYIIFAALIYLYFKLPSIELLVEWQRILIMGLGCGFGVFVSMMGYYVVRREGEYFLEATRIYNRTVIALRLHRRIPQARSKARKNKTFLGLIGSLFATMFGSVTGLVARACKKDPTKRKKDSKRNLGIRDGFQLTFLITALLFIVFGTFSVLTIN